MERSSISLQGINKICEISVSQSCLSVDIRAGELTTGMTDVVRRIPAFGISLQKTE
jgi:hypothetical protein